MLKQTVHYIDFNGNPAVETLHFHLTRTDMLEISDIEERLEAWSNSTEAQKDENGNITKLTPAQIRDMIGILKTLFRKSYGERSTDGKHFRKTEEIYTNFEQSAVYDAFMMKLFTEPDAANNFMMNLIPKLTDEELKTAPPILQSVQLPENEGTIVEPTSDPTPWITEDREPTPMEMRSMSQDQLIEAYKLKAQRG